MLRQYLKIRIGVVCIFCLCGVQFIYAQDELILKTSVKANFGVDADVKSGILSFTDSINEVYTDDWFLGSNGLGVIDVTDTGKIAELTDGKNVTAQFRMSESVNPFWLDAVYLRDYYSNNNEKDLTIFGGGDDKNYDDPTTWTIKNGSVPPKNDIIDVYGHLRLEDQQESTNLWVFGAVSTRTQNGDNYIDFEYFRKPVTLNPATQTLNSDGVQNGHTAYQLNLDNNGEFVDGDVILSVNYINGGTIADFRFYAWINSDEINGLDGDDSSLSDEDFKFYNDNFSSRRFDFGDGIGNFEFYNCNNDPNIPFGYARISLLSNVTVDPIFAQDNSNDVVDAPIWGTIGPDGNVNQHYVSPSFIEFALNASLLGLDAKSSSRNCSGPLGYVIVKTRTSASFTSELKDLAGPFTLGATPGNIVTISEPEMLTCTLTEITLTATTSPSGDYTYQWFKDTIQFDDNTPGNNTLTVTEPGHYYVKVILSESCSVQSNGVEVIQNNIEPDVSALGGIIECSIGGIQLDGSMSSTNPNADLTFEWTGPNNFVNSTELNPIVSLEGTYILTVTDNNNGCTSTANAEVTSESSTLEIQCPQMIEVQCIEDIPQPNINTVIIINGGEGNQPTIQFVNDVSDHGSCPELITRTYSATDSCGNIVYCSQMIYVNDKINPEILNLPDYQLEACNAPWPGFLTTNWTDNCSVGGSINSDTGVDDGSSEDGCIQYRLYTFTVTDSCGNTDTETTRISRKYDMTNPEISDIPDYQLEGCNAPWPEFLTTTWIDNCTSGGSINSNPGIYDGSSEDGCIQYRLYTFTVTDSCGNVDTETTRVSREFDMTNPEITDLQDYQLESCNVPWPEFLTTNWTDNCSVGGSIYSDAGADDGSSQDGCVQYRLYTFTITDSCGNVDTETTQVSRGFDMTNPEISDIQDYQLEGCNVSWPEYLTTTWIDNCASGGSINSDAGVEDGSSQDGCIQYRLYTFTVTDSCGNVDTETTRVSRGFDMTSPEINDLQDYQLEGCNAPWPGFLTTNWTDNCSVGGSINSDSGVDDGGSQDGCVQYRLYTFTVTDNCGNTDSETTRVGRGFDTTNPEISDIPDYQLESCNAPWPGFLTTNWTDNCSVGGSINSDAGVDNGSSQDSCTQYRLYTFTITDSCGNVDTETTRVGRGFDTTNPEITDLQDYQLESCNAPWPEYLTTTWTDSCTSGGSVNSDAGVDGGSSEDGCIQYRLYTFTVTDSCGNTGTKTTRVSREYDMTNPEIMTLSDYQLEGCNAAWPEYLTTTWTDNCAAGGSINSDAGVDDGSSPDGTMEYRLYTFTVTDNCGNISTKTTRVTKIIGSGTIVEGEFGELCRKDFPAPNGYDLTILLPDDSPSGGVWSLHSGPDNVEVPISQNGSIIPANLPSGDYEFWYTVDAGVCDLIIKVWVTVLDPENEPCVLPCTSGEVSTAVTPNGDQVNDTFDAGLLTGGGCTVDVQIFNRWGAKIFEAVDYQNDWSCTVHSNAIGSAGKITTGTYYYILQFKIDDKIEQTKTGFFYVATE